MTSLQNIFRKPHGFTLVELIVTITILTILSAIGFVTMTGYFAGSRDSARLADMNNIYGQLDITRATNGDFPMPDDYRTITLSGTTITYQGYAGKTVLSTIKFNGGGRDPKDNIYYTYTINKKQSQSQLMGYFEEYDVTKLSNVIKFLPEASAASIVDYTDRKIGLIGKKVGTLVESGTLVPVQQTSTGTLEISTTPNNYRVYFDNTTTTSGTGDILNIAFTTNSVAYTAPVILHNNNCTLSGTTVLHGSSITAYTGTSVPYGSTCTGMSRTCTDGTLSGDISYQYPSCNTTPGANCSASTYSGATISALNHGSGATFTKTITNGTGDVTATCTNGTLAYGSINTSCATNYVASGSWNCITDTCTGSKPIFAQINGTEGTALWAYNTTPGTCKFQCQAGYYWNGSDCIVASAGYYVASAGSSSQTACGIGTYQDLTGQTSCKTPTAGYWASPTNSGTGNISQTQCLAGTYCSGGVKITTTTGYYTSSVGSTTQTACTAGYYCTAGSTSATQTQCPANNYCVAASPSPIACGVGLTSPIGSTNISQCISKTITLVNTGAVSTNTITLPSGIQAGDLIIASTSIGDASTATPPTLTLNSTGYTLISSIGAYHTVSADADRIYTHYKIAIGNESGTTFSFTPSSGTYKYILVHIFRLTGGISSVTIGSINTQGSIGTTVVLNTQTVTSGSGTPPLLVYGLTKDATALTFSPVSDGIISASTRLAGYKIYNSSPVNISVSMTNAATTEHALQSFYLQLQ